MLTFIEWLDENHPVEEGWAKNLAIGGTMLAAGLGAGRYMTPSANRPADQIPSSSVTSPDAVDYFGDEPHEDGSSWTSPDADSYFGNTETPSQVKTQPKSKFQQGFGLVKDDARRLKLKTQGLKPGQSRTFIHGQPVQ